MNKKLLAVAVAGAVLAPLAAQAQTANVTLYGRMNLDTEYVRGATATGGGGQTNPNAVRISSNSSRFGLRGEEKINDAISAIFQIESSISGDAGSGTLAGRDTFVGLKGNAWGQVRMGFFHSKYDELNSSYVGSTFYTTGIGYNAALWGNCSGGANLSQGCLDTRLANSLRYDTPNWGGFTGTVQYSVPNGGASTTSGAGALGFYNAAGAIVTGTATAPNGEAPAAGNQRARVWVVGGEYKNGPIGVGAVYLHGNGATAANLTTEKKTQGLAIQGSFTAGPFWAALGWERLRYESPDVLVGTTAAASGNLRRDWVGVASKFKIGDGTIQANAGRAFKGKSSGGLAQVNAITSAPDSAAWQGTLGYDHAFSKRTSLYTYATKIWNQSNGVYSFSVNPYGTVTPGKDPVGFVVGIKHDF